MGRRASREISPCNYVFVYGTLRKNYLRLPANVRKLQPPHVLLTAGTWFGEGRLSGYDLWDLGDYPGIVKNAADERSVCGDIVRIDANAQMMQTLDAYEGISSEYIRPHEYQREVCRVSLYRGEHEPELSLIHI